MLAQIGGEEDRAAVAGQPGEGRGDQPQLPQRLQVEAGGRRRGRLAVADGGHGAVAAGQDAGLGVAEIAGGPAGGAAAAQGHPGPPAVAAGKDAGGKQGRRVTGGPAVLGVEEVDSLQGRQQQLRIVIPVAAAVASGQQHAGAGMQKRVREAAGCPAGLGVDETDGPQRAGNAGVLQLPVAAAVAAVPDRAAIADRPALLRIAEADVVQPGVVAEGVGGDRVEGIRGRGTGVLAAADFRRRGVAGRWFRAAGGRLAFQAEDFPGVVAQPGGIRVRGLHEPGQGQNYQSGHGMGLSSVGSRRRERRLVDCMAAQGRGAMAMGETKGLGIGD